MSKFLEKIIQFLKNIKSGIIYILIAIVLFVLMFFLWLSGFENIVIFPPNFYASQQMINVEIDGNTLTLEPARSYEEKRKGLMDRTQLNGDGMIFIYEKEANLSFWMKNTVIPLDILFFDKDLRLINFYENTIPNQTDILYPSLSEAKYVIELPSGKTQELKLKVGNLLKFLQ